MFRRLTGFFAGTLCGAGAMYAAYGYHVVRAPEGPLVVAKTAPSLRDCYADVREWTAGDWANHPRLAAAVTEAGHGEMIARDAARGLVEGLFQLGRAPEDGVRR
ncbi:MAG: hypothetical protein AAF532_06435 [Planctomycetota bacterium]